VTPFDLDLIKPAKFSLLTGPAVRHAALGNTRKLFARECSADLGIHVAIEHMAEQGMSIFNELVAEINTLDIRV
jgi:hypothetical protein